jgi:hypothetical protein
MLGMLNPRGTPAWSGSRVAFFKGIMALEPILLEGEAPIEGVAKRHTTTLHFLITRAPDAANRMVPIVKTKARYDTSLWSEAFIPFKHCPSGLSPHEIPPMKRTTLLSSRLADQAQPRRLSRSRLTR